MSASLSPSNNVEKIQQPSQWATFLSLFSSGSTLLCCALPALLVTLGAGAALSGLVSAVPQLVWVSENKGIVFTLAGAMLALAGYFQWRASYAPCPTDPALRNACMRTRKFSRRVYYVSLGLFLIGAYFAFCAPLFGS